MSKMAKKYHDQKLGSAESGAQAHPLNTPLLLYVSGRNENSKPMSVCVGYCHFRALYQQSVDKSSDVALFFCYYSNTSHVKCWCLN